MDLRYWTKRFEEHIRKWEADKQKNPRTHTHASLAYKLLAEIQERDKLGSRKERNSTDETIAETGRTKAETEAK